MKISSQNLTDGKQSIFAYGRAWLRAAKNYNELGRLEWGFGKHASNLSAHVTFGPDENERGIMFHLSVPFVASIFLTLNLDWIRAKERRVGFAVHNDTFWLYIFYACMGDHDVKKRVWYQRYYHWDFPWQYDWHSTEILEHEMVFPHMTKCVHLEKRRGGLRKDAFAAMREAEPIKKAASETYDYTYTRKSGEVQHRKATVYVDRMTWRMRWFPILPFKKVRTSINVQFDAEVGEGTGSWKGGCTGCGYEMRDGETPLTTLRRMEHERKFGR
jgi:hypothetical protein